MVGDDTYRFVIDPIGLKALQDKRKTTDFRELMPYLDKVNPKWGSQTIYRGNGPLRVLDLESL